MNRTFAVIAVSAALLSTALGRWADIPLRTLVHDSDLIVMATLRASPLQRKAKFIAGPARFSSRKCFVARPLPASGCDSSGHTLCGLCALASTTHRTEACRCCGYCSAPKAVRSELTIPAVFFRRSIAHAWRRCSTTDDAV